MECGRNTLLALAVLCLFSAVLGVVGILMGLKSRQEAAFLRAEIDAKGAILEDVRIDSGVMAADVARLMREVELIKGETLPALSEQVGRAKVFPYIAP